MTLVEPIPPDAVAAVRRTDGRPIKWPTDALNVGESFLPEGLNEAAAWAIIRRARVKWPDRRFQLFRREGQSYVGRVA